MSDFTPIPGLGRPDSQSGVDSEQPNSEALPGDHHRAVSELRSKAMSAVALVAGRNLLIKVVALLGNVVFARLLSPTDFGTVAFGLTVLVFGQLLSDGGLGVGLIRRAEEPQLEDLRALLGFQLLLTTILAAAVAATASAAPFGRIGHVTAVMMLALPLLAFRAPSSIVFERGLAFAPLLAVEVAQELAYYGSGIASVALGAGVWGLATASVFKALVGTGLLLSVSPVGRLVPSLSWQRLKPMLGFGVRFQAVELVNSGGTQLLNIGIAGVGGLAVLGLWTLAWRLAQIPYLLFSALWRVSYPAAAQLLSAGESARRMIERGLALSAVATGAILAPATGALSPLVPAVFGHRWAAVADVLPVAFFALQASGPVSVATAGYLYAVGDTATVLRAAIVTSVVWLLVALPLLPALGLPAVGVGWMVSSLIEIPILAKRARRRTGAAYVKPILAPWIVASLAGASGWLVSRTVSHGLIAAFLGVTVAASVYAVPIMLLRRDDVLTILRLGSRALRSHRPARAISPPAMMGKAVDPEGLGQ
jgi:O-antigen/teichoic acid export membrane protein